MLVKVRKISLIALFMMLLISFSSCRKAHFESQIIKQAESAIGNDVAAKFSAEEKARIQQLRDAGGLKAVAMVSKDNYFEKEDGEIAGLDYLLAEYCAEKMGVPLIINVQDDFSRFFSNNGSFNPAVINDENIIYVPDLIKTNDVYILPITVTKWRERIVNMLSMYPAGVALYGKGLEDIKDYSQLNGRSVAVMKGVYLETLIDELEEEYTIEIPRVYIKSSEPPAAYLMDGRADFTIEGYHLAVKAVTDFTELTLFPLPVNRVIVGWVFKKDDDLLESIIAKLYDQSLEDGYFQRIFYETFNVDFDKYIDNIH
ncbi:MAG: transporter substrate-binding domain-containing protein [Spirochaetales bacterium]|uniref:Transporter substrate-binding domain-containing protein n=1 Tax=Candidatus Thalassospirochaeta sargassi TaxID=3119039 RepID=A0AAJ1MJY2_9SPIO|nr:transporter substrate-binding domain-containing protein [Spirochaetales bacterium]